MNNYDILCIVSKYLNTTDILKFRLISYINNEVFLEYWIKVNYFVLEKTRLDKIPEWLQYTKLVLIDCTIKFHTILEIPKDSIIYNMNIDKGLNDRNLYTKAFLDFFRKLNNIETDLRVCNCSSSMFCSEDYCRSLYYWLPEYKHIVSNIHIDFEKDVNTDDTTSYIRDPMQLFKFIGGLNIEIIKRMVLVCVLCIRHIDSDNYKWMNTSLNLVCRLETLLGDSKDKSEVMWFFQHFVDVFKSKYSSEEYLHH